MKKKKVLIIVVAVLVVVAVAVTIFWKLCVGKPNGEPPPTGSEAIMANGDVYWMMRSMPEENIPAELDESELQSVTSYTDGTPEKDGQANFGEGKDIKYMLSDDGLLQVCVDNEWYEFYQTDK